MQIDQFPYQYEQRQRENAFYKEMTIRNIINNKGSSWEGGFHGALGGAFLGFFACVRTCGNGAEVEKGLETWLVIIVVGAILGFALHAWADTTRKSRIEKIHEQEKRDCADYKTQFETEARKMSVRYNGSPLTAEVINRLTGSFSEAIDAADRSSRSEKKIEISFPFSVYPDKITREPRIYMDQDTYDFRTNRCENLTSPLQQTAIAMAIASSVQRNIAEKYPKDVSGTDVTLNIFYTYGESESKRGDGYVTATIVYTAPNSSYRPVRSW